MKNFKLFIQLTIVLVALMFASCNKENLADFIRVTDAEFVNKSFPDANGSEISFTGLTGNSYVLAGGVSNVSFSTDNTAEAVLIGIKGEKGYYVYNVNGNSGEIVIVFSQDIDMQDFVLLFAIMSESGNICDLQELPVQRVEAKVGKLQVSLSWDQLNDVDLHLVEPDGEEIYYGNGYSSNDGELDLDSNPGCSIDGINNENIVYGEEAAIETGEYIVRVDFYSNCNDISVPTNYSVAVTYNGELISPSYGSNPASGSFNPDEADYGGAGSGETVMKFYISNTKSGSQTMTMQHIEFPEHLRKPRPISSK